MASYHDRLVKHYGVTDNPYLGGFLLPDGMFLDFSEGSGMRIQDHRNVEWVLPTNMQEGRFRSRYEAMAHVCRVVGMYRWMPESWSIEAWTLPTSAQLDVVEGLTMTKQLRLEGHANGEHFYQEYEPYEAEDAWRDLLRFYRQHR